jgi:YgiT-type zinc finger domain-containing protein
MNESRPRCAVCNLGGHLNDEQITETDDAGRVIVVIRGVPAQVCDRCGTTTVTDDVAAEIEQIVAAHQGSAVSGSVVVDYDPHPATAAG